MRTPHDGQPKTDLTLVNYSSGSTLPVPLHVQHSSVLISPMQYHRHAGPAINRNKISSPSENLPLPLNQRIGRWPFQIRHKTQPKKIVPAIQRMPKPNRSQGDVTQYQPRPQHTSQGCFSISALFCSTPFMLTGQLLLWAFEVVSFAQELFSKRISLHDSDSQTESCLTFHCKFAHPIVT